jgi:S1-C subfamily serine protease
LISKSSLSQLASLLSGLPVYGCLPNSPAERAGVRYGDVLLSVDGQPTPTWEAYLAAREHSGATIRLRLFRDGYEFELDIILDRARHVEASALASTLGLFAQLDSKLEEPH